MKYRSDQDSSKADRRSSARVVIEDLEPRALFSTAPLAAPTAVAVTVNSPGSIELNWSNSDPSAEGYFILRSTQDRSFVPIAQINNALKTSFTDTAVAPDTSYKYRIESYGTAPTSLPSTSAPTTTPLLAPSNLVAIAQNGGTVQLSWTDNDSNAAGYDIFRSSDGVHFSQTAIATSRTATTFTDTANPSHPAYTYEVFAYNGRVHSPASNPATESSPGGAPTNAVAITIRYGDELVVTAPGPDDTIALTQSGSSLTIDADGQNVIEAIPAAGVFVYTRGGADAINIASSVTALTTIDTIDAAATAINSAGTNVSAWIDSTDTFSGSATVHRIASFAGGVSKALGASLANPSDAGTTRTANMSLWGTGPAMSDVNQGASGDCYFLSSLAAFANTTPNMLHQSAVDLGDGTYAVQFYSHGTPQYVRVSNALSSGPFNGFYFANPGSNNTIWAMVMEKAFTYFRTGANTYESISGGWMGEVYTDFGVSNSTFYPYNFSDSNFFTLVTNDLAAGKAITLATGTVTPDLVSNHAYTLVSAYKGANGVNYYIVRNPWGMSGDSLENSHGYATLTMAQLTANFVEGCRAA